MSRHFNREDGPKMPKVRFWILCAMAALLVSSGMLLLGARYWAAELKSLKNMLPAEVDMKLERLTLNENGADGRTMIINATNAHYYKTQDLFILDEVRAKIITDEGSYDVSAASGHYTQKEKTVELKGAVRVVDPDGGVLTSEVMLLEFQANLISGAESFCYSAPKIDLTGTSFVFNTQNKILQVEGRTHLWF